MIWIKQLYVRHQQLFRKSMFTGITWDSLFSLCIRLIFVSVFSGEVNIRQLTKHLTLTKYSSTIRAHSALHHQSLSLCTNLIRFSPSFLSLYPMPDPENNYLVSVNIWVYCIKVLTPQDWKSFSCITVNH